MGSPTMLFLVKVILTLWVSWVHGQERECIVPDIEQNLIAQPRKEKYVIGDVLKFSCRNRLHSLVGPDSLQCYHFGWSPNPPTCKEKVQSCDQPPQLPNGTVADTPKEEYGHGEVVEYVCKPRFLLKGAKKIQCVDGEWTPLPVCVEEHSTCGDVPELEDGEVVSPARPTYHHGDSVAFTCRDDFTMIGHSSVTCIKGTWTQTPQCIATIVLKTCKLSGATPYKLKLTRRIHYEHNRKISYTCERTSVQKHSVCMNGKWEPEVTCTEAPRCPPPPQIPNSQHMTLTVNYQEGEKISILCQENFLMQEGEEIVCQDGRWQSIPRCVENTPCSQPPQVEHGSIKSSRSSEEGKETSEPKLYAHGTTLSYICKDGFKLSQEDGITCHLGTWSAPPQCVGLPCGPPPEIANAVLFGRLNSYPHGQKYTYTCDIGFEIQGPASVECSGEKWSSPPECTKTICSTPPSYGNAILIGQPKISYKSGEQVTYRCPDYYQMDGSNFVECRGGIWIGRPTCKDLSCGSPPPVQNAFIPDEKPRYRPGDTARYECTNSLGLFGNAVVTCLSGKWTDPPECKETICSSPPSYGNAILIGQPKNSYKSGEQVTYRCPDYYQMDGSNFVECRGGIWIGRPTCKDLSCGSPPPVQNAFIPDEKPRYRPGDTARYECTNSLGLFGNAVVTCLSGKWTDPPECKETICSSPPSYGNAILIGQPKNSYKSGEQVTYRCPDYYQMDGSNFVECRGGIWIGRPTCKDLPCGSPPPVQNAFIPDEKPRYRNGDTARYECTNSLGLFGNAVVTCLSGKWTDPPECKETICSRPPSYGNAILIGQPKNSYKSGEKVTYRCPENCQMDGSNFVECKGGIWIGTPTCKDLSCGSPPPVQNAFIPDEKPRYRHGDTARYECMNSLGLFGNAVVTCLSGKWTDPPECKESTGKCAPPPAIDNGDIMTYISPFYAPGSSVEYQCQAYYELEGNRRITCRDGEWSEPPKCLDPSCGSPPPVQNAFIPDEKPRYQRGDTARYECRHPLGLFGNAVVTCLSGKWTDPPECKDSTGKCGPPPVIDNGDITTYPKAVYAPGSSVEYQCQAYYELEGNRRITCRDGEWSEPPKCLDLPCGSPPPVQNAFIPDEKPRYQRGDTARYECRHPLGLFGNAVVTCLSGKWTDPPECKESTGKCGPPPVIDNGDVTTFPKAVYTPGSSVEYQCQAYYELEGNRRITCRDGEWSEPPKCLDPSCGSPPPVQNAFIPNEKPRYRPGDTARYQCRHLLDLLGNAVVTCLSGKWTDPPECKDSTGKCGPPPIIDNGDITTYPRAVYAPGSSVEYQCQAYYELEGNRRITCHDGEWSEPPKCLDACVISEEIMREHNIALKWSDGKKIYATTNDYTEFRCRRGYRKVSPASAFRAQCREGKLEYPTCALKW